MAKNNLVKYAAAAPVLALTGLVATLTLVDFSIKKTDEFNKFKPILTLYTTSLIGTSVYILKS
jgi:hypothetical protein